MVLSGSLPRFWEKEKFVTMLFDSSIPRRCNLEKPDPKWSQENRRVELRIPEADLRETVIKILQNFQVIDFQTEKLPIERVVHTLLSNPEILHKGNP